MNEIIFSPHDSGSAARFLAECSRLAQAGSDVSVRIGGTPAGDPVKDETVLEKMVPEGIAAVLSFGGLSGIIEVSPSDMLIRAKGGTPVADIALAAEEAMLWFPHYDGSIDKRMNIASLLMEAPVLAVSETYGGLREYVLSVDLVTGAGEKVHFGSRSVKDVAGYEVIGLLLGGGGRYGMITEVTLRLIPKPAGRGAGQTELRLPDRIIDGAGGPFEAVSARVQKVFDPAGILRW
jgi:FAD/FMN-containing dehydrogenase